MAFPQKNYTYGRYRVYFDRFAAGTKVGSGQRYIGNTPELSMTSDSENLDHFDADNGIRIKDDSMLLELNRSGSFVTDHISPDNLAMFFLGETSPLTQAALPAQSYSVASARKNHRIQIGAGPTTPAGARGLDSVVVTSDPAGTTYDLNVDYTVNTDNGGLVILEGGSIADGAPLLITYGIAATSYTRVITADNAEIYGAMYLESRNPKGEKMDYFIPYCSIRPDGDFSLKGDDWQQLPFSFEILKLDDSTPSLIINGAPGSGL